MSGIENVVSSSSLSKPGGFLCLDFVIGGRRESPWSWRGLKYNEAPEPHIIFTDDVRRVSSAKHQPLEAPIDVRVREAIPLLLPNLDWLYLNRVPSKLRITNTGRTVILSPRWSSGGPRLRGGPLRGEYILSQIHFHWGATDDVGSEHSVDGKRLPLEMHAVSYNSEYSSHERALAASDGTVVTVFFFLLQDGDNPALSDLTSALSQVTDPRASVRHPSFALSRLVPAVPTDYLLYWGTIGSRDVRHRLLWLLDRRPIPISHKQMSLFRRIHQLDDFYTASDPAPVPTPGSVFHADPTRRPPSAPTLLPISPPASPSNSLKASPWLSPRLTLKTSPNSSLLSNRLIRSLEKTFEKKSPPETDNDIYKSLPLEEWDQERGVAEPFAVPVGYTFGCRRSQNEDKGDTPYLPAQPAPNVQKPDKHREKQMKLRQAVEARRAVIGSSESSESESTKNGYHTPRSSFRSKSQSAGNRRGGVQGGARSITGRFVKKQPEIDQVIPNSGSRGRRKAKDSESLTSSVEIVSSDLSRQALPPRSRQTEPSVINTCGIEDLIIETLPPNTTDGNAAPRGRTTNQPSDAQPTLPPNRDRPTSCWHRLRLSRDHPNAQPLMEKSLTGSAVAGSFVQEEQARRRQEDGWRDTRS